MSDSEKSTYHRALEALIVGASAGALVYAFVDTTNFDILGMSLSGPVAVGSAVAVSSFVADNLQHYVLPEDRSGMLVGTLGKPLVSGATAAAVLGLMVGFENLDTQALAGIFGVGVAAEVAGVYVSNGVMPYLM
jgi:hypothetical protein